MLAEIKAQARLHAGANALSGHARSWANCRGGTTRLSAMTACSRFSAETNAGGHTILDRSCKSITIAPSSALGGGAPLFKGIRGEPKQPKQLRRLSSYQSSSGPAPKITQGNASLKLQKFRNVFKEAMKLKLRTCPTKPPKTLSP